MERKKEIAKWFEGYKSKLTCEKCGQKEAICLDFHHLKEKNKVFTLGRVKSLGLGEREN